MRAISSIVAITLALLCGVQAARYHGRGEFSNVLFHSFHRYARQAMDSEPNLINQTTMDNHQYYTSTFHSSNSPEAERLWFDLSSLSDVEIILESTISNSFRVFDAHQLRFDFPFYGHFINVVAVTTGGFLYASDYLHSQIHLTQYIAPLQADFDPSHSTSARVLIHSTDERFTVQWDRVRVIDHIEDGEFTFQVSLFRNGTIHFAYRDMPLLISEIMDDRHPVEVGVADSFYIDRPIPPNFILRQVYEYSRIQLDEDDLNFTAYVLDPLPGCVQTDTCEGCVNASRETEFQCGWCPRLSRCSDGVDRFRQEWLESGCTDGSTTSCSSVTPTVGNPTSESTPTTTPTAPRQLPSESTTTTTPTAPRQRPTLPSISNPLQQSTLPHLQQPTLPSISNPLQQEGALSSGAMAGVAIVCLIIVALLALIVGLVVGIFIYGYKNPTSSIGMFMIEHRPKARSLNKAKASYDVDSGKANLQLDQ